jgi:hypothetical protein
VHNSAACVYTSSVALADERRWSLTSLCTELFTSIVLLIGVCFLAMPLTTIGNNFTVVRQSVARPSSLRAPTAGVRGRMLGVREARAKHANGAGGLCTLWRVHATSPS